jgi:hypothetical protein
MAEKLISLMTECEFLIAEAAVSHYQAECERVGYNLSEPHIEYLFWHPRMRRLRLTVSLAQ